VLPARVLRLAYDRYNRNSLLPDTALFLILDLQDHAAQLPIQNRATRRSDQTRHFREHDTPGGGAVRQALNIQRRYLTREQGFESSLEVQLNELIVAREAYRNSVDKKGHKTDNLCPELGQGLSLQESHTLNQLQTAVETIGVASAVCNGPIDLSGTKI